jgi:hypothetical protein
MASHQLSMFDTGGPAGTGAYGNVRPAPPSNGTATSDAAAASIKPILNELQARVLAFLREQGDAGATAQEIESGAGLGGSTVRPRLIELRRRGDVVDSGRTRPTASGRQAAVWIAT